MNTTDKILELADALSDADFELARINSYGGDTIQAASAAKAAQDKLRAEIEALVRDAERYRWLRRGGYPIQFAQSVLNDTPFGIDAAIDAAMQEKQS